MLKWQIRQRKKAHESIIQNAKPTIRIDDLLKTHQILQPTLNRTKNPTITPPLQPKHNLASFTKILQLFNLQQYSTLLIDNGFPFKLSQKRSMKFIDDILDKVQQKDQEKFLALMNTLIVMSKDMIKGIESKRVVKNNFHKIEKSSRITQHPPQSVQRSYNNIVRSNRTQKNTHLFKVRQTTTFKSPLLPSQKASLSSKFSLQKSKSISNKNNSKQLSSERQVILNNQISSRTLRKMPQSNTTRRAKDDIYITHSFRNSKHAEPILITQRNKIISRLIQKLNNSHEQTTKQVDINLQLQKIKKMYMSFDSVRLTSNIGNIDLEEMIDCLVEQIHVKIERREIQEKVKNVQRGKRPSNEKMRKQGIVNSQKYIELDTNKEEIEFLLKESLIIESQQQMVIANPQSAIKLKYMPEPISTQDLIEQNTLLPKDNASQTRSISVDLSSEHSSIQSSDFEDIKICDQRQSLLFQNNFACFDDNYVNGSFIKVDKQDIKNFIQLVMMAGKMEKEMIIIAYIYVRRLLVSDGRGSIGKKRLTMHNWRNILLVTLISASKIWDDTSLENHSFAKVLQPYTTYEINRLEKHFLFLINYKLTIQQQEYCEGYFELRQHSTKANKTAHLMSLDIKTILRLEEKKAESRQKEVQLKEYYRKKMDRSF